MLSPVEIVFVGVVVCGTLFWISMLVDCIKHEPRIQDRLFWAVIIALTHFVGALLYFFVRRPVRSRLVAKGRKMSFAVLLFGLLLPLGASLRAQPAQTTPAAPPASPPSAASLSESDLYAKAEALVAAITAGKNDEVAATFNEEMRQAIPSPSALPEAWRGMEQRVGPYQGITGRRILDAPPYRVVVFDVTFGKMPLELRIPYEADGKIAGFRFFPKPAAPVAPTPAPGYSDASKFDEQEVTVGSGEWALQGTLTLPKGQGPFPAVVLVHGSGPSDRDETVGAARPFRDLAWGLATRGIAVLRYEKRTLAHARKMTPEVVGKLTVREETVDDAVAGAELLRATAKVDPARVYVLGHSLGAMLAPRIAALDPKIAGLILLAPPARPLEDLLPGQFTHLFSLDGKISEPEQAQIDLIRQQVAKVKIPELSPATPSSELPLNLAAPYWLDLRSYDQVATARQLGKPILILQGGRDYQVTSEDLDRWKAAFEKNPKVRIQLFPKLDHLFRAGDGQSSPEDYNQPGNVAPEVVGAVAEWMLGGVQTR
jgi:dienelactone hydrolase